MDAFLFRYNDNYQNGHEMIVSLDSTAGVGLILQKHPNAFVFDKLKLWQNQPKKWVESLGERSKNLGLSEPENSLDIDENNALITMDLKKVEPDIFLKDIVFDNLNTDMSKAEIDYFGLV